MAAEGIIAISEEGARLEFQEPGGPLPVSIEMGRALERHDAAGVAACYTEDAVYTEVGTGLSVVGRAAIEAVTREVLTAFPDARFGLSALVGTGHEQTVEWWAEGTHLAPFRGIPSTGRRFRLEAASVLRLAEGRIAAETCYLNAAALLRQAAEQGDLQVLRRYFHCLSLGDGPGAAGCFAASGIRRLRGVGGAVGRADIARQLSETGAAGVELLRLEVAGAQAVAEYRIGGAPGLSLFHLDGEAIREERVYISR